MLPNKDFGGTTLALSDEAAERAILASLINVPSLMVEASTKVNPEDFVNEHNKYLYGIMLHIFKTSEGKRDYSFDLAALHLKAKERGAEAIFLERMGGKDYIEYLNIIKTSWTDPSSFGMYIEKVHSLATKRKLIDNINIFKERILDTTTEPETLMVQEGKELNDLLITMGSQSNELINLGSLSKSFLESAFRTKREIIGLRTGFTHLDRVIEGLQRARLYIVAAPRKTGKTAFLLNVGVNVGIKSRIPTLMISTEMNDEQILSRVLSNLSKVPERNILKGNVSEKEKEYLQTAQEQFDAGKFHHVYMPGFTVEKIIANVRKFVNDVVGFNHEGRPRECLVLFDYIKLPQVGISGKEQKEYKILGQICDSLKILCGNLDIPILTACQTNRGGDTANSYEITWYCDTYMELTKRTENELKRNSEMNIDKGNQSLKIKASRNGEESDGDGIGFNYNGGNLSYDEVTGYAAR